MKGLLLKDWYMTLRHYRMVIPLCLVFLVVSVVGGAGSNMFYIYPGILMGLLPFSAFAYDEKEGWLSYTGGLPVSRGQYVSAKYLLAPIGLAAVLLLSGVLDLVYGLVTGELAWQTVTAMVPCAAVCLVMPALMMPLVLRFGAEKGRIVYYVLIGFMVAAVMVLSDNAGELRLPETGASLPLALLCAGAAALYALSWLLSLFLYRRRELA